MANNYRLFSSEIEFPASDRERVQAIVDDFIAHADEDSEIESLGIEIEDTRIMFLSEEWADIKETVTLAQKILDELQLNEPFVLEWAETCSELRVGEFGGGAVIVRRGMDPEYMNTHSWVLERLAKLPK